MLSANPLIKLKEKQNCIQAVWYQIVSTHIRKDQSGAALLSREANQDEGLYMLKPMERVTKVCELRDLGLPCHQLGWRCTIYSSRGRRCSRRRETHTGISASQLFAILAEITCGASAQIPQLFIIMAGPTRHFIKTEEAFLVASMK